MDTLIPAGQQRFHFVTEALSVALIAPFAAYLAIRGGKLSTPARVGLGVIALSILAVDGWLLTRWTKLQRP